jgi:hypothetical protein
LRVALRQIGDLTPELDASQIVDNELRCRQRAKRVTVWGRNCWVASYEWRAGQFLLVDGLDQQPRLLGRRPLDARDVQDLGNLVRNVIAHADR